VTQLKLPLPLGKQAFRIAFNRTANSMSSSMALMNVTRVLQDMNDQIMTSVVLLELLPKLMTTLIIYQFMTTSDWVNIKNNPDALDLT